MKITLNLFFSLVLFSNIAIASEQCIDFNSYRLMGCQEMCLEIYGDGPSSDPIELISCINSCSSKEKTFCEQWSRCDSNRIDLSDLDLCQYCTTVCDNPENDGCFYRCTQ